MATYQEVKGTVAGDAMLSAFTTALVACVRYACGRVGRDISGFDEGAYGVESTIPSGSIGTGGLAASAFSSGLVAPHASAFARHFLRASRSATMRMDVGNVVEQFTFSNLRDFYTDWTEGVDYLYQKSTALPPAFPINYMGTSKSARPDFRVPFGGGEAVFDITTPREAGHLLDKKVDGKRLGDHAKIPVAVEILWEDKDLYGL